MIFNPVGLCCLALVTREEHQAAAEEVALGTAEMGLSVGALSWIKI